jgi:hypothetical protein
MCRSAKGRRLNPSDLDTASMISSDFGLYRADHYRSVDDILLEVYHLSQLLTVSFLDLREHC